MRLFIIILLGFSSCTTKSDIEEEGSSKLNTSKVPSISQNGESSANLEYFDYNVGTSCKAYGMYFSTGETIYRFSIAGSCVSLSEDEFLESYQEFLDDIQIREEKIGVREGEIIIEPYDDISVGLIQSTSKSLFENIEFLEKRGQQVVFKVN